MPAAPDFVDLILRFERSGREYRVHDVAGGAASTLAIEDLQPWLTINPKKGFSVPLTLQEARATCERLSAVLFQYEIRARLTALRESSRAAGKRLRLQLELEGAEELDELPWELLATAESGGDLSILRWIPSLSSTRQPPSDGPLQILALVANPKDLSPFDVGQEWEVLDRALAGLQGQGRVALERLEEASEPGFQRALARRSFHVIHYVGCGRSNLQARHGSIFLEDQSRRSRAITAEHLAGLLEPHRTVRLAMFETGGIADPINPFAGTARILVRNGFDSVIAMRRRLGNAARMTFHQELYSSLADGSSIDRSVANARNALTRNSRKVEWDAPMVYTCRESSLVKSQDAPEGRRAVRDVSSRPGNEEPDAAPVGIQRPADPEIKRIASGESSPIPGSAGRTKILVLAASPDDLTRLRVDKELREIDDGLQRAKYRDRFQLMHRSAVRPLDLQQAMLDFEPQIVHFCGHGSGAEGLVLEDNNGLSRPVSSSALANLFRLFSHKLECVVLNSCHSEHQAEAISHHVPYVVGMKRGIGDQAAINFAIGFYRALGAGHSIDFAYQVGRSAIELEALPDHLIPVLLVKSKGAHGTSGADVSEL
jgi:hypothetical protein